MGSYFSRQKSWPSSVLHQVGIIAVFAVGAPQSSPMHPCRLYTMYITMSRQPLKLKVGIEGLRNSTRSKLGTTNWTFVRPAFPCAIRLDSNTVALSSAAWAGMLLSYCPQLAMATVWKIATSWATCAIVYITQSVKSTHDTST